MSRHRQAAVRRPRRLVRARRRGRRLRRALIAVVGLVLAVCGAVVVAYRMTDIPKPHPETAVQSTVFLDMNGDYLGRRGPVDRQDVRLSQVPRHVQDAVITAENRSFRTDSGVSPTALVRAAVSTLSGGGRQGGSTITQQYVKNALLSPEQSLSRKAREALIAVKLDRTRSKDQILEGYHNTVYFGRGAAGIQSAARNYFGVDARDLTLAQGAALAAVINLPSYYERVGADAKVTSTLRNRWEWVLDGMRGSGLISARERAAADFPAFRFHPPGDTEGQRQYLIDVAAAEVAERLGISQDELARGGYTVRTTFDLAAQDATTERVRKAPRTRPGTRLRGAVVAMVPRDGAVRAVRRRGLCEGAVQHRRVGRGGGGHRHPSGVASDGRRPPGPPARHGRALAVASGLRLRGAGGEQDVCRAVHRLEGHPGRPHAPHRTARTGRAAADDDRTGCGDRRAAPGRQITSAHPRGRCGHRSRHPHPLAHDDRCETVDHGVAVRRVSGAGQAAAPPGPAG
ncbi:transglycosylase domain-containing protein [Streptomyces sp. NPDC006475]|uniref:transglycosylase domain-containing protein n=1 Tax=Streptomyces sp. NPDC006475 TaxID=3155719 RepID=UPI0033A0128F